ncbi:MAG: DUF4040 domain-containing protein [Cyanobacteria bacterium P01_F01_bin.53]
MTNSLSLQSLLTENFYILGIAALFPLMGCLTVLQTNPYQALVVRGILGAIAALVYTLFGAADVALTEALVGTFLSITLYAVAVRSSLKMRLGILDHENLNHENLDHENLDHKPLPLAALRSVLEDYHMQLEVVAYADSKSLQSALTNKEIHASYTHADHLRTRIKRLYEIMRAKLPPSDMRLSYLEIAHNALITQNGQNTQGQNTQATEATGATS